MNWRHKSCIEFIGCKIWDILPQCNFICSLKVCKLRKIIKCIYMYLTTMICENEWRLLNVGGVVNWNLNINHYVFKSHVLNVAPKIQKLANMRNKNTYSNYCDTNIHKHEISNCYCSEIIICLFQEVFYGIMLIVFCFKIYLCKYCIILIVIILMLLVIFNYRALFKCAIKI